MDTTETEIPGSEKSYFRLLWKLSSLSTFGISIMLHLAVFLFVGGVIIFEGALPETSFVGVTDVPPLVEDQEEPELLEEIEPDMGGGVDEMMTETEMTSSLDSMDSLTEIDVISVESSSDFALPSVTAALPELSKVSISNAGKKGGSGGGQGGGYGTGTGKLNFFGVSSQGNAIVLLIDISGSMIEAPRGRTTWNKLEKEVERALLELEGSGAKFNLVAFSGGTINFKSRPISADEGSIRKALRWLKKQSPVNLLDKEEESASKKHFNKSGKKHSGTRADLALDEAFRQRPDVILFLSDGQPSFTGSLKTKDKKAIKNTKSLITYIKELQQKRENPAVINTVAYLANSGQSFMKELARKNGGKYKNIK